MIPMPHPTSRDLLLTDRNPGNPSAQKNRVRGLTSLKTSDLPSGKRKLLFARKWSPSCRSVATGRVSRFAAEGHATLPAPSDGPRNPPDGPGVRMGARACLGQGIPVARERMASPDPVGVQGERGVTETKDSMSAGVPPQVVGLAQHPESLSKASFHLFPGPAELRIVVGSGFLGLPGAAPRRTKKNRPRALAGPGGSRSIVGRQRIRVLLLTMKRRVPAER